MALYEVYATKADLAAFLEMTEDQLPVNSNKLLKRASELIKQSIIITIDLTNTNTSEALQLATCAQVEYWIEMGESTAIVGQVSSFSLGDLSMNMGDGNQGMLSARARSYLNNQGLLYRGITLSSKEAQKV
jgi:hypothetical protein